jgi:hypothetical protein
LDQNGVKLLLPNGQDQKDCAEIYRSIFRTIKKMIKEYPKVQRLIETTMYLFFDTETAREKTKLILDMAKIAKCPDSYGQKKI